jgi:hypothetical protein
MLFEEKIIFSEYLNKINKIFLIPIKNELNSHIPKTPKVVTGDQFFRFELDGTNTIVASLTRSGEVRVYVEYIDSDYRPEKIKIGVLLDDVVVQDTVTGWLKKAKTILEHECWPECLAALNKAATIAIVMLT